MAYEPAVIEQWIYETLSGDATLLGLLAVDNKPDGYQMGIYNTIAPQTDPVSRKPVQVPYVVFSRAGASGDDEDTLCGARVFTTPNYRITVWDTESGAMSMARIQTIMNRIDTLLDNQTVTTTTPRLYVRRTSTDQTFTLSDGGRTDFGVTAVYRCLTQQ
jgi:hypothetical protein